MVSVFCIGGWRVLGLGTERGRRARVVCLAGGRLWGWGHGAVNRGGLGAAYDSMGLPWNDARRVVEPDEGAAPNARELLLEFGGFVVDSDDALETAEPLEMYPFELTNELFIYQRAKVPISGDDVDLYVLVDRVV